MNPDSNKVSKASKPNWRERLEAQVAGTEEAHGLCRGVYCSGCPFTSAVRTAHCIPNSFRGAELNWIWRHALATVKDFTDRDEIRARIAEMLDDDAREKFLGKAAEPEPKVEYSDYCLAEPYKRHGGCNSTAGQWPDGPYLKYAIRKEVNGLYRGAEDIITVCRDKDTRDKVLEFLNNA